MELHWKLIIFTTEFPKNLNYNHISDGITAGIKNPIEFQWKIFLEFC